MRTEPRVQTSNDFEKVAQRREERQDRLIQGIIMESLAALRIRQCKASTQSRVSLALWKDLCLYKANEECRTALQAAKMGLLYNPWAPMSLVSGSPVIENCHRPPLNKVSTTAMQELCPVSHISIEATSSGSPKTCKTSRSSQYASHKPSNWTQSYHS